MTIVFPSSDSPRFTANGAPPSVARCIMSFAKIATGCSQKSTLYSVSSLCQCVLWPVIYVIYVIANAYTLRGKCRCRVVQCSSTCGPGEQVRAVVCRRMSAEMPSCSPQDRPSERRTCRARIPCYGTTGNWYEIILRKFVKRTRWAHGWIRGVWIWIWTRISSSFPFRAIDWNKSLEL